MKNIDRRTFLRGTGLSVGLPLLNAMNPNTSVFAAAPHPSPNRMAFVFFPNGAIMDSVNMKFEDHPKNSSHAGDITIELVYGNITPFNTLRQDRYDRGA